MELKLKQEMETELAPYLLIVPYGIETSKTLCNTLKKLLLIVPYGIETGFQRFFVIHLIISFNRTLWN